MSKEMTPKEAFQSLVEIYDITKSSKQFKIINKALNSVEETKTNYHIALAFCEASKEEKQKLRKQIEQLEKEINTLNALLSDTKESYINVLKENQELEEKAKKYDELCMHNVMESQSFGDDLIQGILAQNKRVIERNKKMAKVIDWLKNTFEITLDSKVRISDGTDCIQAFPIDLKTNEIIYDLIKEVLENDRN